MAGTHVSPEWDDNDNGAFPEEFERIKEICDHLVLYKTRGDLGDAIARQVMHYSMYDLQVLGGSLVNEVAQLPSPYREAVRPYFTEQIFGMYHRLLLMYRSGQFGTLRDPVSDPDAFSAFCQMVPRGCFCWDEHTESGIQFYTPFHRLFYYLISGFSMFVLNLPGHPVGMPFPGGIFIEEKDGTYFCPVREKEKDVFYSICNFCPAIQSETGDYKKEI